MEAKEHPQFVGRKFTNVDTNYYSAPIDAYGAKLTESKYFGGEIGGVMGIDEGEGTKIRINKSVFFYDTLDSGLSVIKVKSGKGQYDDHKVSRGLI